MKIAIDHIAKIEGHAGFIGKIINGEIKEAKIEVQEGARLFESMLIGRKYDEAPTITSRICGVCPVAHNLTSIKAIENAFGIEPTPQTIMLRQMMMAGQIIHSHVLHLFFLVMSDFYKVSSGLDIIEKHPEDAKKILALRSYGNKIVEIIGGRTVHPLTSITGGFTKPPKREMIELLIKENEDMQNAAKILFGLIKKAEMPAFDKVSQYVAFSPDESGDYFAYEGNVKTSFNESYDPLKFLKAIREKEIMGNPSKRSTINNSSFMVGALSRMHLNGNRLNPEAKKEMAELGYKFPAYNPFHNNVAQAIEIIHLVEEVKNLGSRLLKIDITNVFTKYEIKAGNGIGALEVPRGTLYHYYEFDEKGIIANVNIITPTAQFLNNLEEDIKYWLEQNKSSSIDEQKRLIAMITRAYDPCITCATH